MVLVERGFEVLLSPRFRDLSREVGIVVQTPGEFYPPTTEEPNLTEEHYAQFMFAVIGTTRESGLVLESREHYNPAPKDTGGGIPYVGDLFRFSIDHWRDLATITSLAGLLFPDQFKNLGEKLTSAVTAIRFTEVWTAAGSSHRVTVGPPAFLQPTIVSAIAAGTFN